MFRTRQFVILILFSIKCIFIGYTNAKIYERCEFVQELVHRHNTTIQEAGVWACIAEGQSSYNTAAIGGDARKGPRFHGIFQISDEFWCSPPGKGWVCGVTCQELRDNDITDDFNCAHHIYQEHFQLSGDGFNAWPIYQTYCKANARRYVIGCDLKKKPLVQYGDTNNKKKQKPPIKRPDGPGKIYQACELANELLYKHHIAADQIATWVCIAKHESGYNTSAINRGSGDYGLFQISELYWCGRKSRGKACDLACSELMDNNISDDVKCMMRIYDEHTRLQGNGFKAWTVYERYCKGGVASYIDDCFKKGLKEPEEHLLVVYKRPSSSYNYYQRKTTTKYPYTTSRTTIRPLVTSRRRQITTTPPTIPYNQSKFYKKQSQSVPVKKKSPNSTNNIIEFYLNYFNNRNLIK